MSGPNNARFLALEKAMEAHVEQKTRILLVITEQNERIKKLEAQLGALLEILEVQLQDAVFEDEQDEKTPPVN
jgi:uncharacterized coiled-coil protein SlyX